VRFSGPDRLSVQVKKGLGQENTVCESTHAVKKHGQKGGWKDDFMA